jgi:hypothetical protein
VRQDLCVGQAGVFEGVGQDDEAGGVERPGREGTVVVGGLGEGDDGWCLQGGGDGGWAEGVAETIDFFGNSNAYRLERPLRYVTRTL